MLRYSFGRDLSTIASEGGAGTVGAAQKACEVVPGCGPVFFVVSVIDCSPALTTGQHVLGFGLV